MGIADSGNLFATTRSNQISKKAAKAQAAAHAEAAERDLLVLQHIAAQTEILTEIRDLLKKQ